MSTSRAGNKARHYARALAVQAHYQQQINTVAPGELLAQFRERREHERADAEYFEALVRASLRLLPDLSEEIAALADRDSSQLDPVEVAVLRVALTELRERIEVPYRVVINEAVELARQYGAESGHKYVNAILDRAAATHRAPETRAHRSAN